MFCDGHSVGHRGLGSLSWLAYVLATLGMLQVAAKGQIELAKLGDLRGSTAFPNWGSGRKSQYGQFGTGQVASAGLRHIVDVGLRL